MQVKPRSKPETNESEQPDGTTNGNTVAPITAKPTSKLRASKVNALQRRLKLLMFGPAGVGKTVAALQMPKPYVIDTEHGTDHYGKMIEESGGAVLATNDFSDVLLEVNTLISERHGFKTFVLDSFTPMFEGETDAAEIRVGSEWGKHVAEAAKPSKKLFRLLTMLDMNVVVTAHGKPKYERGRDDKGKISMVESGQTFDGWKKLDYIFDLVLELQRQGTKRIAIVRKTRLSEFPDQSSFEWSIDELRRRCPDLERDAAPIPLASPEQVARLSMLVANLSIDKDIVDKWLSKAEVENFAEMTASVCQACIDWCSKRVNQITEAVK